ncbi:MAG: exodeoxyribonuclease VII small subunit [Clostridia bacterium]|nr:exodeoxyribonuclease VII small subunit [Clostridia bacterium]
MIDDKLKKLETIASKLDSEDVTLDEGVKLFEEGTKLAKECYEDLSKVKGKMFVIKEDIEKMKEELFE